MGDVGLDGLGSTESNGTDANDDLSGTLAARQGAGPTGAPWATADPSEPGVAGVTDGADVAADADVRAMAVADTPGDFLGSTTRAWLLAVTLLAISALGLLGLRRRGGAGTSPALAVAASGGTETRTPFTAAEPPAATGPTSFDFATTVSRVAAATRVDPEVLRSAAASLWTERAVTRGVAEQATSTLERGVKTAAAAVLALPLLLVVLLMITTGSLPTGVASAVLLGLAGVLATLGVVWLRILPERGSRLFGARARAFEQRRLWIEQVAPVLDTAALFSATGAGGRGALEAAAPNWTAHPVRRALDGDVDDDGAAPVGLEECSLIDLLAALDAAPDADAAGRLLRTGSAYLQLRYRADVDQRLGLTALQMIGPAACCLLPAMVLVYLAFRVPGA